MLRVATRTVFSRRPASLAMVRFRTETDIFKEKEKAGENYYIKKHEEELRKKAQEEAKGKKQETPKEAPTPKATKPTPPPVTEKANPFKSADLTLSDQVQALRDEVNSLKSRVADLERKK
eukprot:TRINITY_DN2174_c0_g1_i1.p1 TRINITY_DN2174_c0_g1~~TRINITY_DN2174_c0_g1_i1.p1  ORF type:complete len:120 (-),score=34.84 TRINITY_DN2174_c0_g1_i1:120-479(-)